MPQPTSNSVHVNAVLGNISTAYIQDAKHFIAADVFPVVTVEKKSDLYFKFDKADFNRDEAQLRGDSTEASVSGYDLTTDSYTCQVYAKAKDVGEQAKANSDEPLDWQRNATQWVTQQILIKRERKFMAAFMVNSVWGTSKTVSALWSDFANSDPIQDVETGKKTILLNTGFMPNTLTFSYQAMEKIRNHPDIVARHPGGTGGGSVQVVDLNGLAVVFGVDRVLVSMAVYETALEGETSSMSFIAGRHALLTYAPSAPALENASAGYVMEWQGVSGGTGTVGIESIEIPLKAATRIQGQAAFDMKLVAADCGYFFNNVVAA